MTVGEREMLAAYVSGLNACRFCHGNHKIIAEIDDTDPDLLVSLLQSPADSSVDEKWLPLLAYVRKLTESPATITDADAQRVFEAGFSEDAIFDAVSVCPLFSFMNRIVAGCGVGFDASNPDATRKLHKQRESSLTPYSDVVRVSTTAE